MSIESPSPGWLACALIAGACAAAPGSSAPDASAPGALAEAGDVMSASASLSAGADLRLDGTSLETWRRRILPSSQELSWTTIPWLVSFAEGVVAARDQDRPLLLWVMNGHPLGCT